MDPQTSEQVVEKARRISQGVLRRWAAGVDAENRFPRESVDALREGGFFGFFVPVRYGGLGGDLRTYHRVAALFGEECLSTAMIWAMHCQQVAVLAAHAADAQAETLAAIAREGIAVASVTSEYGKGGDLLTAQAALQPENGALRLVRRAPTVSYGAEAGFYLITMRKGAEHPPSEVELVLACAGDGELRKMGEWNAMGMRGTRSVPMEFDLRVGPERIIGDSFRRIVLQTLVPVGHLGWSASWYGGARGAFQRFVAQIRSAGAQGEMKTGSDLLSSRLADLRLSLDLLDSYLDRTAADLDSMRRRDAPAEEYEGIRFNIRINNLKLAGSRIAFSVVNDLVELAGLSRGYLKGQELGLERVFRDLRSAALMFHNDRLAGANGRLILVEDSRLSAVWSGEARAKLESTPIG